jgi:protein-L-isoaspartate(D-aspartate) O-methyltransferase
MGQTISQPYIVALMTEALELTGEQKVLEVGTGSGYQTAILCELASHVVSVERHQPLLDKARQRLDQMGYTNVELHMAGDALGWEQGAPYDGIIVTAGAPNVPRELVEQLAMGGRMVIPVGGPFDQDLLRVTKHPDGITTSNLGGCRFVPLIGESAWSSD